MGLLSFHTTNAKHIVYFQVSNTSDSLQPNTAVVILASHLNLSSVMDVRQSLVLLDLDTNLQNTWPKGEGRFHDNQHTVVKPVIGTRLVLSGDNMVARSVFIFRVVTSIVIAGLRYMSYVKIKNKSFLLEPENEKTAPPRVPTPEAPTWLRWRRRWRRLALKVNASKARVQSPISVQTFRDTTCCTCDIVRYSTVDVQGWHDTTQPTNYVYRGVMCMSYAHILVL